MTVKDIQLLLSADEAMVLYSVVDKQSYVIAITREGVDWKEIPLGADALTQKVTAFPRDSMSARRAMPPANPACSISRSPTKSMSRCSVRSSR